MTPHAHRHRVPGCYRCELSEDEVRQPERCWCGDRTRPHINHRKTIPCWTYIGSTRYDINIDGEVVDWPLVPLRSAAGAPLRSTAMTKPSESRVETDDVVTRCERVVRELSDLLVKADKRTESLRAEVVRLREALLEMAESDCNWCRHAAKHSGAAALSSDDRTPT